MNLLCKLGFHRWTENNKLSRLMMIMQFEKPFGCTRCGIRKDDEGNIYPMPEITPELNIKRSIHDASK